MMPAHKETKIPGLGLVGISSEMHVIHNQLATKATYEQKRNPYFLALHAPKLIERNDAGQIINKGKAIVNIGEIIVKVAYDCGQAIKGDISMLVDGEKKDIPALELLATSLLDEIIAIFPTCTVEEVRMALSKYVRGDYGEFKGGLNIVSFNHAIRSFIKSSDRQDAKREVKSPMIAIDPVNSEEQYKKWVTNQFNHYKATGVLQFSLPSFQFKEMEKWGLIKLTKDEKLAMLPTAKINLIEAKRLARLSADKKERQSIEGIISRVEKGMMNERDDMQLKHEARKMAIKIYYDSITELPKF